MNSDWLLKRARGGYVVGDMHGDVAWWLCPYKSPTLLEPDISGRICARRRPSKVSDQWGGFAETRAFLAVLQTWDSLFLAMTTWAVGCVQQMTANGSNCGCIPQGGGHPRQRFLNLEDLVAITAQTSCTHVA